MRYQLNMFLQFTRLYSKKIWPTLNVFKSLYRASSATDGVNNSYTQNSQFNNGGVFFGTDTTNVVGEPPPSSNDSNAAKNLVKDGNLAGKVCIISKSNISNPFGK